MSAEQTAIDATRLERKRAAYAHMSDVHVKIEVELGRKYVSLHEVRQLQEQDVIELDKLAGEALEMRANGHLFAVGEIVVITDLMACRITQFVEQARGK